MWGQPSAVRSSEARLFAAATLNLHAQATYQGVIFCFHQLPDSPILMVVWKIPWRLLVGRG